MTTQISFKVSKHDFELIDQIVCRALSMWSRYGGDPCSRQDLLMDISAVHANGCRLRLAELLGADDFNFAHDIAGIRRHLNRHTGELVKNFWPRFAVQQ